MSLLDGALSRPGVLELSAYRRILPFYSSIRRNNGLCCYAKISVDDDERKHETSRRGFSLRVPTIPKLRDIESARRLLETAFQALAFEMPRIPIESALHGLTFDIFKLSIPKRSLAFDITGFVATKLKKPPKDVEDVSVLDDALYPRCAWPRMAKAAPVEGILTTEIPKNLQDKESGVNSLLKESTSPKLNEMHWSSKGDSNEEMELGRGPFVPSLTGSDSFKVPVGPHCAWPRKTHRFGNAVEAISAESMSRDVQYARSAQPRNSLFQSRVVVGGQQSIVRSVAEKEELSPCIIEGGPRCAWPRKTLSAKQSCYTDERTKTSPENLSADGSKWGKDVDDPKISSADFDGAAELPRRMLATSVGLSLMNQLVKGSIATSLFDFCSLLPAGYMETAEEEDGALDLSRRTLLVFIKRPSG